MNWRRVARGFCGRSLTIGPASALRAVGIDDTSPEVPAIVRILGLGQFLLPTTSADVQERAA